MPDATRPPGTGGNVHRVWDQRRVFPPRPPPPPPPPRRPPPRGGLADRDGAAGASVEPAGRNAAAAVVARGEARQESGGGRGAGVGSKRPSAPPAYPPPKRRAVSVSASPQLPPPAPASRRAAAPAPLAVAGSRVRFGGERENRGLYVLGKPAAARPLAAPANAAGTRVLKKPNAKDGAAPMANTGRHGPEVGMMKPSAVQGRGRGAGTDQLSGKKKVPVTATRLPPKPENISATHTSRPGRGKDRPLESGRAHGGLAAPKEALAVDDHSSLAHGRAVEIGFAAGTGTGTSAGAAQHGKSEKREVPSKESRGSQVSSDALLLDPSAGRDLPARDSPGVSGKFGRKTWAQDVKVMNKYDGSSYALAASSARDSSKPPLMRKMVSESGRTSSDVAAGVSSEVNVLRSKNMFTNRNASKAKVVQKPVRGRQVSINGIQDSVQLTKDRVMQAPISPDMCPMTHKKKAATTKDFFGHTRMVKPKALDHQQEKVASTCVLASKGKLDDEVASNLTFHDIFRDIVANERKLELHLNSPSGLPSVRCQRQYRYRNADARSRSKMWCRRFEFVCRTLAQIVEQRSLKMRIDYEAAKVIQTLPGFTKHGPIVGQVPGVEVGDEFLYRSQLMIAGLHSHSRRGIATTTHSNGMLIAISIVASGGYPDELGCPGELIYTGSGGKAASKKKGGDQKLQLGNLALKNCIKAKTPVRVIHGFKCLNTERRSHSGAKLVSRYTYDGLYLVVNFWMDGQPGSRVFKYKLEKIRGQPELPMHIAKTLKSFKSRPGLCMTDISQGKEATPICVINTVDDVRPARFKYSTRIRYPFRLTEKHHQGCYCTNGCSDSVSCACAVKNGGEIPFDLSGTILNQKSVIFECGPSCKCPTSCHNRVSQHNMKIPLEVFRTTKTGWGVRSLRSIPSGSFICEYIGELLHQEADKRRNNSYLFDVGLNYDDENLSSGLLSNVSGLNSSSSCSQTMKDVHFTIDASEYGNIGRFINHSCSPNLQAQNVLWGDGDKRMPHIMFFAAETIPPLQELTYDYNDSEIDRVRGVNRRMESKVCECGSLRCRRRFY